MEFVFNDGGRTAAGFKGKTGDCVTRAVVIATQQPYQQVYDAMAAGTASERRTKRGGSTSGRKTAREGIHTGRKWFKDYMASIGWRWVPTMFIGGGCKVHLADGELPPGRLIVAVSKHYTTVIDGVVHDTHDPQREPQEVYSGKLVTDLEDGQLRNEVIQIIGGRCVYGFWVKNTSPVTRCKIANGGVSWS